METSQVLEEMFAKYKLISLEDITNIKDGKEICVEGYITDYLEQHDGFFISLSKNQKDEGEDVVLKYMPRIGISLKKMEKLCDIVKEHNLKLKVCGELIQEKESATYKELEIHSIEFKTKDKKFRYPNSEMIEGSDEKKPIPYVGTDSFEHQVIEKEFYKIHNILNTLDILNMLEGELDLNEKNEKLGKLLKRFDNPKTAIGRTTANFSRKYHDDLINYVICYIFREKLQCAEAEFEFYKVFDEARFNAEKKLKENAPKVQILEGAIEQDVTSRL